MGGFRFFRENSIYCLQGTALAGCDFIIHAFCTRRDGVSRAEFSSLNFSTRTGDDPERVSANWRLLSDAFGIPSGRFLSVSQVHGDAIYVATRSASLPPHSETFPYEADLSCDAVITDLPGLAVGVKTADCVPILLADRVKCVVGAVHAGWRGTSLGLAGKTVQALRERFSSRPHDILVAIGPAIGPCCYEVDEAVSHAMISSCGAAPELRPAQKVGRWMLDLPAVNRRQIEELGVPAENISSSGICTSCREDLFYSHRRDGNRTGRHFNFIMVRG